VTFPLFGGLKYKRQEMYVQRDNEPRSYYLIIRHLYCVVLCLDLLNYLCADPSGRAVKGVSLWPLAF